MIVFSAEKREVDEERFCLGTISACSIRSPAHTGINEDALAYFPLNESTGVLVVADGAGGQQGGEKASRIIVETFAEEFKGFNKGTALSSMILSAIDKSSEEIKKLQIGAGSTLATIEIDGSMVRPYHVGDSSILIVGQKSLLKLQSIAHSPLGYARESGMVEEEELHDHEEKHIVSNLVGADDMRIEIGSSIKLSAFDTVLVTSDGVTDNIPLDDIIEVIRKGDLNSVRKNLIKKTEKLMANQPGSAEPHPDDFSFILFRLGKTSLD